MITEGSRYGSRRSTLILVGFLLMGFVVVSVARELQAVFEQWVSQWTLGTFDDYNGEFDTDPHDDPEVVDFAIGEPIAEFPSGLGTDVGSQRSLIHIHFSGDLSGRPKLVIRWSAGGSGTEQFRVECNGQSVADSLILQGTSPQYYWVTQEFTLPPSSQTNHQLSLSHLSGDGLHFDGLRLDVWQPSGLEDWGRYH